jgi:hypothetical protein
MNNTALYSHEPTKLPAIPAKNGENGFLYESLRGNKFPLAVRGEHHDAPP